jgi:hypothetical protein
MTYRPRPIDTRGVVLSDELLALTEQLAENTHEIWASLRMEEGWTHGPETDGHKKLHRRLVPYEQLPESEKRYDRIMALETLRVIVALGFRIERSTD